MFQVERREFILEFIEKNNSCTVEELSEKLNVSPITIRRDLQYLDDIGKITRTFGGAVLKTNLIDEIPYAEKTTVNKEVKENIAKFAASLIKEGNIIILDAGTTNMEIAKNIKDFKSLTVVSTDINIAAYLCNNSNLKIICTGGIVQNSTGACIGMKTSEFLKNINADIVFIGTSSADVDKGITTPTIDKAEIKKQMLISSNKKILILDSTKFRKVSFAKVCDLKDLDMIITDANLNKNIVNAIKNKGINLKLL